MAYILATKREAWWPIKVASVVDDEKGGLTEFEIRLRYRLLTRTEQRERMDRDLKLLDDTNRDSLAARIRLRMRGNHEDTDFLLDRVVDWEGPVFPDKRPVPFTRENLEAACEDPRFFKAAFDGLYEASEEVPRKNS